MIRDAATERQVQSADPAASTWLSANAGSGKTRVLTDRAARLLLAGVMPQHVLCLTYTKAASSEMQNRLFKRLGEWAMLDDEKLRESLRKLGLDEKLDGAQLARARQLFARAIETPGGLKIQTIHSFCSALLRRFPLEAGVSPQFNEMDDRAAKRLREDVTETIAMTHQDAFDGLARHYTLEDLAALTAEIAKNRAKFTAPVDVDALWHSLGLPPGFGPVDLAAETFLGDEADLLTRLADALAAGSANDLKARDKVLAVSGTNLGAGALVALEDIFLTKSGKAPFSAKIGSFPTKAVRVAHPDLCDKVDAFMGRVETARKRRTALVTAEKSLALHRFAHLFLAAYAGEKQRRGWLDFDDLILRAHDLLSRPGIAEWVLYRLDGGIDHILVDEAQDTSPLQWKVIDLLAQEFTSGLGARGDLQRTIFVVGDKKQSIYSFQGADPDGFDRMKDHFAQRLGNVGQGLQELQLEHSFRSSDAILRTVDATFQNNPLGGLGLDIHHLAFRTELPGRVDLWPAVEKGHDEPDGDWTDPVNIPAPTHPNVVLAERIAQRIADMIAHEVLPDDKGGAQPVKAGDILILVQRRSALFHEIIRACKTRGLPIAGADRLKIGGELAVKDLTALLSFLSTPEDSLSLACALRSPLLGWSEKDLFDLAAGRDEKFLWETLRNRKDAYTETFSTLSALRAEADFLRPFELIERILTRHRGREKLIARLGDEAEDGIDAFLSQALAFERNEIPSLTGFLHWLASDEIEIKRQLDSAGDRIRVMTVHGSKGLEAPIVFLPDTGKRQLRLRDEVLKSDGSPALWKPAKADSPPTVDDRLATLRTQQEEERQRLLYVAMTRAESWLIACAAGDVGGAESWYNQIDAGLKHSGATPFDTGFGPGMRLESGSWQVTLKADSGETEPVLPIVAPPWATQPAPAVVRPPVALSPSDLGGAKALPGEGRDEEEAKALGTAMHTLLETLPIYPADRWDALANSLLGPTGIDANVLLQEARAILQAPDLAFLFAEGTRAEVGIAAQLEHLNGARINGVIDRLIVSEGRVLAVDYKTNRQVPDRADLTPEGLLRQMGAYAAALEQVFPDHEIDVAILWTRSANLMHLPSQLVADALRRVSIS